MIFVEVFYSQTLFQIEPQPGHISARNGFNFHLHTCLPNLLSIGRSDTIDNSPLDQSGSIDGRGILCFLL